MTRKKAAKVAPTPPASDVRPVLTLVQPAFRCDGCHLGAEIAYPGGACDYCQGRLVPVVECARVPDSVLANWAHEIAQATPEAIAGGAHSFTERLDELCVKDVNAVYAGLVRWIAFDEPPRGATTPNELRALRWLEQSEALKDGQLDDSATIAVSRFACLLVQLGIARATVDRVVALDVRARAELDRQDRARHRSEEHQPTEAERRLAAAEEQARAALERCGAARLDYSMALEVSDERAQRILELEGQLRFYGIDPA